MSIATDQWTGFMLLCAMRYCMGRQSYSVAVCTDYLKGHWQEIDPKTRATMRRDLADELEAASRGGAFLGANFYDREWRSLLTFMDETPTPKRDAPEWDPEADNAIDPA